MNGLTVALATPSLFSVYKRPPRLDKALALGISQSGKSPDIVAVLAEARRQGALTAALTNVPSSELAQQGDVVVDLHAGAERAVAATKTYMAELTAVALFSATLAADGEVEPYSSADFLHGPLALIEPGFPVIVIAPSGVMQTEIREFMRILQ